MSWFSLQKPVGTDWSLNTGDLKNTKQALSQLGYYKAPPERGIDDWADSQMFDGVRAFQKDNGLKVDAFMRPGGPTEKAINAKLATASPGGTPEPQKGTCAEPAGFIVGTMWDRILRRQGGGGGGRCYPDRGPGDEEQCEQLYEKDSGLCRDVGAKRGTSAAEACWRSASERYAACKQGRPMPPLNTGDW